MLEVKAIFTMCDMPDWNTVVFNKPKTTTKVRGNPAAQHNRKLADETENMTVEKVSFGLSKAIEKGRAAKGWTRKQLASQINVTVGVITDYETGKAVPNGQMLQKLSRALGIPLRKNM